MSFHNQIQSGWFSVAYMFTFFASDLRNNALQEKEKEEMYVYTLLKLCLF